MGKEIAAEWLMDSRGQAEMTLLLFQKAMFRIAHIWACHIDLKEYIELLEKVYCRIIAKKVIRGATGQTEIVMPRIAVEIFQDGKMDGLDDWMECEDDEEEDVETFEYKHEEDAETLVMKKFKKRKPNAFGDDDDGLMSAREPFNYRENVEFFQGEAEDEVKLGPQDIDIDVLGEMRDIYPLGYPAEQFICKLKNDVHDSFI